jgi:hypothetical protein
MRTLACLGFVLVVTSANAQTGTTVDHETHTVTTTSPEHPASSKIQAAHTANPTISTTTATKSGGDQPMGDGGDKPVDADSNRPVSR